MEKATSEANRTVRGTTERMTDGDHKGGHGMGRLSWFSRGNVGLRRAGALQLLLAIILASVASVAPRATPSADAATLMTIRGTTVWSTGPVSPRAAVELYRWNGSTVDYLGKVHSDANGNFAIVAARGYYYYLKAYRNTGGCNTGAPLNYYEGYTNWFPLEYNTANPFRINVALYYKTTICW